MKRLFTITLFIILLAANLIVHAEDYNLLDMYQKPGNEGKTIPQVDYRPLYDKYPLVGADNATCYYLDTSSCTAYHDGSAFIIACIVYNTGGGSPPMVKQSTYKFSIRKIDDNFSATLVSINDSAELAQQQLNYDNGYLRFLLLQAAKYSGYPAAKIQALNQEAETQLKKVADAEEKERQEQIRRQQQQSQSYSQVDSTYVGNVNSGKFHRSNCPSVSRMKNSNKVFFESRDEAVQNGYTPCQKCRP